MPYAGKRVLGIIPARGGSKGLHRKNIVPIDGLPLIVYSINAGLKSKSIDTVLVSSDDDEIIQIAENNGASTLRRPDLLATDTASIHDVIAHAIEFTNNSSYKYDMAILLQPTSPLRSEKHIDDAFNHFGLSEATCLISVYKPKKSPYKCFVRDETGYLKGLINNDAPFMNRQDLADVLMPNGAIYIFKIADFMVNKKIPVAKIVPYMMDRIESIDIDTQEDADMVNAILKNKCRKKNESV